MKDKVNIPTALLVVAAFLAPITGGYISTDSLPSLPGTNTLFAALLGDAAVPFLSHALIALPVIVALVWVLAERQVLQVPNQRITISLLLFLGLIVISVGFSAFKAASIPAALEWLSYGAALMATVAVVGRRQGPMALLTGLFTGCVVVALKGIVEYGESNDKTWRIFGGWIGPNALAAMLLVGLFVGLGIMLSQERLKALLAGLGVSMIGFALVLTQSKGGLLAFGVALLVFAVTTLLWSRERAGISAGRTAAVFVVIVALAFGLQAAQKAASASPTAAQPGSGASPLARFTNSTETQEQSVGFRSLLWKGAIEIWKETPTGVGVGAYRFASAKPGLTTQTQLTHESYLQLLAEASILAPVLLVALLVIWTYYLWHGARGVPLEQRFLRAGVFAAVAAIAVHSLVDSDLQYYGVGLAFFMLLGVGLLLSCDSAAPEFVPMSLRTTAAIGGCLVAILMLFCGWGESTKAAIRGASIAGDLTGATALVDSLRDAMPWDGEAWYLSGQLARSEQDRLDAWQKAVDLAPSARNIRALARAQAQHGDTKAAVSTLLSALRVDPNNLLALKQLMSLFVAEGDATSATNTAKRLLAVEATPYFKIRSEPEIVPLETAEARMYLAHDAPTAEKADLLSGALKLFADYAAHTVPAILQMVKEDPNADYGGETVPGAIRHMNDAKQASTELAATYRQANQLEKAVETEKAGQGFDDALARLEAVGRK